MASRRHMTSTYPGNAGETSLMPGVTSKGRVPTVHILSVLVCIHSDSIVFEINEALSRKCGRVVYDISEVIRIDMIVNIFLRTMDPS